MSGVGRTAGELSDILPFLDSTVGEEQLTRVVQISLNTSLTRHNHQRRRWRRASKLDSNIAGLNVKVERKSTLAGHCAEEPKITGNHSDGPPFHHLWENFRQRCSDQVLTYAPWGDRTRLGKVSHPSLKLYHSTFYSFLDSHMSPVAYARICSDFLHLASISTTYDKFSQMCV